MVSILTCCCELKKQRNAFVCECLIITKYNCLLSVDHQTIETTKWTIETETSCYLLKVHFMNLNQTATHGMVCLETMDPQALNF